MIWILILNHLYLGDLILILKSSTYDDFAHLWVHHILLIILPAMVLKYINQTFNDINTFRYISTYFYNKTTNISFGLKFR